MTASTKEQRRRRAVPPALLIGAGPVIFLTVFFAWPVSAIVYRGLVDESGQFDPFGTARLLGRATVWDIAAFTIGQAAASTVLTLAAGLPVAWLLARVAIPGRTLLRVVVTVPFVLPTVVVGIAFRALFSDGGLLGFTGLDGTVWAILLAHAFFNVAVVARTVGSVWAHLDPRTEQAARSLGASPARAFCTVTVPALAPAIVSAAAVVFLFCATSFGVVLVLGGTRYRTLETEIYLQTVQVFDLRMAAVLSLLQMLAIAGAIAVATLARRGRERALSLRPMDSTARAPRGRQWIGVGAVLALVAGLLIVPPCALLVRSLRPRGEWSLEGYRLLAQTRGGVSGVDATLLSLRTATDAAILSLVVGVLAAIAIAQARGRFAWIADGAILIPLGISAVTVGFGFLITLGQLPGDLRSSAILIPIAQALVAIPLVVRIVLPAMRAVNVRLREGAAVLGASPVRVWFTIDLPLVARSIAAAAGFAFVVTVGEFGATSFLARAGDPTLPVLIGRLIARPGAENASVALAGAVLLVAVTATVVTIIEIVRIRDVGEF
ncbi:ABC transporter permease [Hoyosella altamirensis]|uniref:Thiamine transport system permease protein n=1 Tax=Hoyosella altamirensis TaxID=616997 RepID=A0A839RIS2_9ACTN|nr:iron ABC transporter permease [Hoyosella altamirensis]MBB3036074.1 thiamine transport system permease protein [Hoyosella altamirensis]